jgi:hypothetical protein
VPVLIPNVIFSTKRSTFNPATGVTVQPVAYLASVEGHMKHVGNSQLRAVNYQFLPAGALESDFILCVGDGVDVALYDIVYAITLIDGQTPWPADASPNEFWRVEYIHHTPPGVLTHVECYVRRVTGGGPPS